MASPEQKAYNNDVLWFDIDQKRGLPNGYLPLFLFPNLWRIL